MKRLCLLTFLLCLFRLGAVAETLIDGIYYNLDADNLTAAVTRPLNKGSRSITIPESVTYEGMEYSVTSIMGIKEYGYVQVGPFEGCSNLVSITIPNSVTSIGDKAFKNCTGLTSLTIPNSVTSIEASAFAGCTGLTSLTIPNSVTSIEASAFAGCTGLTSLTIPNSVTTIGEQAFFGCSGLTSLTIPNSVTTIGKYAFISCSGLTSIIVEEGNPVYDSRESCNAIIKTSANELITGCKNTVIPDGVTSIGNGAFWRCYGLTSITIPNSVTSIGGYAFVFCFGLTSITIPNSVTSIESGAFQNCSGLTSLAIPNSVTSIGDWPFTDCTRLAKVQMEATTPPTIGRSVFSGCSALTTIYVPTGCTEAYNQTPWNAYTVTDEVNTTVSVDGIYYILDLFNETASVAPVPDGESAYIGNIEIPETATYNGIDYTVTAVDDKSFYGCADLTAVTIPGSVESIGQQAFYGCKGLTSVVIPNAVTVIQSGTFYGCTSLATVTIPNTVTSIGQQAFYGCADLTAVTIPGSVDSIGQQAFYGCKGLTSVVIPNAVTVIQSGTFYGCTSLATVTIPNTVTSIGQQAFYSCTGLTSISIPTSVKSIGVQAFTRCTGLTSLTIPNAMTEIQQGTFYGCTSLATITIPNTVTSIGQQAFNSCTSLTSLTIPGSVTSMGDYAFRNCSGLTNIFMKPITPPTASDNLFSGCTSLQTIYVPKGSATVYDTTPWNNFNIMEKVITTCVDDIYYSLNGYAHSAEVTSHPDFYTGSLTIPATITYEGQTYNVNSIAMDAFERCLDLTELILSTATPPAADPTIFIDCMSLTTIHIPDGSLKAYNCAPWSDYTLVDAGRERLIQLVADVNNYVTGTSKAAVIPTAEVTRQANELLDEARADVESLTYDVNTVGRLRQLRDYLATGDFAGAENVDISFNRKSNHTGWQSLYVPFDIAYDDIADDFVVAELNNFHQYDDDSDGTFDRTELEVLLLKSGDVIAHHTPYVIRAKETGTHSISLPNATVYASVNNTMDCSSTKIRYVFHGTYQGVSGADMYANNCYAMSNGSLCKANSSNADLSAFRWYLSMEDRNSTLSKMPAKIKIVCIDDDTTTDISEVEVTSTDENAPVYDLNGRLVGRKDQMHHLPKGVYIINGKKVLR